MTTPRATSGFTLIEMAMVLLILGLLLGSGLRLISTQLEQHKIRQTQLLLDEVRRALLGFAITHGRLPCPASSSSAGQESPSGGGACTHPHDGWLPAATLGLSSGNDDGYLSDAWATAAHRLRYAVTMVSVNGQDNVITRSDALQQALLAGSLAYPRLSDFQPDLSVCASSSGITASGCGSATTLINDAVAVVYSVGRHAAARGADEVVNQIDNSPVFIAHPANAEFDDLVSWLSPHVLAYHLMQAGRLP